MFGLSYGEIFLLLGATAALIGPKDLPIIARTAGRFAGRAIGYVQLARGQFENVMQQSQVNQVHKELQDTIAQLEAIRYEVRSISLLHPTPIRRKLDDHEHKPTENSISSFHVESSCTPKVGLLKENGPYNSASSSVHSQAMIYAKFAESRKDGDDAVDSSGLLSVLPVSAQSAGLLPNPRVSPADEEVRGSDIVLEAILEAEVARNAKDFFSHPDNQIPKTEE